MSFSRRIIKYSAVFLAVCAVISATGCNSDSTDNEIVTSITDQVQFSYETAKAQYMTIEETEKIPAMLAFGESDSYYAPFDGKIKVNNLSKNLKVKKGDVLIAIDTTDLDFQINEQQIKIDTMTDSIEKGYAQIELDKLIEQRDGAIITAPYDGIIADCCYSAVGANIKSGTLLCTIAVPESIFVYNSEGAGKNLRFGMDVDLVINNADYEGTITAAPDTIPSDASKEASKYSAAKLTDESLKKLLEINDGSISTENVITGEKKTLNCDFVVLSLGVRPETALFNQLEADGKFKVYNIGDSDKIGRIANATESAYQLAVSLD